VYRLSLYMLGTKGSNVDLELMTALPHLIQLKHFVGEPCPSISAEVFSLIAKTCGSTLMSMHHITISTTEKLVHTLFAKFRRLTYLHLTHSPELVSRNLSALHHRLFLSVMALVLFDRTLNCQVKFSPFTDYH
jgi:hypothetical protein